MRTKKKFTGALTLAVLFCNAALMVGGPPAFAAQEGVVVCARQGAQASGGANAPMSQSNQGTFTSKASPTAATATATPPPTVECDL